MESFILTMSWYCWVNEVTKHWVHEKLTACVQTAMQKKQNDMNSIHKKERQPAETKMVPAAE